MPFPLLGLAIGLGGGLIKHAAIDQPAANRARKASAAQTAFSPWSGMGKGRDVEEPNVMGSMFQGGLAGAGFEQAIDTATSSNNALDAYSEALKGGRLGAVPTPPGMVGGVGGSPGQSAWAAAPGPAPAAARAPAGMSAWTKKAASPLVGSEKSLNYPGNPPGFRDLDPESDGVEWRMRKDALGM